MAGRSGANFTFFALAWTIASEETSLRALRECSNNILVIVALQKLEVTCICSVDRALLRGFGDDVVAVRIISSTVRTASGSTLLSHHQDANEYQSE
jgi:hypothetical protein